MSDLASFLQGKHPNPDAPQMSWEFQGPLIKDWLAKSLTFGSMLPLGGSRAGAVRANDYVTANRLHQRDLGTLSPDRGITGGGPSANVPFGLLRSADDMAFREVPTLYGPMIRQMRPGVVRAANPNEMRFSGRTPANDR